MSETIGEVVLPGTYIDVRAEGLISVGGIATGNVGIVGTANKGPVGAVQILGSYSEALDAFGAYDRWPDSVPSTPALTLTRTLEQLFKGGATSVFAVRIANVAGTMPSASLKVLSATDAELFTLTAKTPGTWANDLKAKVDVADGQSKLTLTLGRVKEIFSGADAGKLAQSIAGVSTLVNASTPSAANAVIVPTKVSAIANGGPDGANVSGSDVSAGLSLLEDQPVNIVVVGGLDAATVGANVLEHLDRTETDGRERVAVMGASTDNAQSLVSGSDIKSNGRMVLVAPGIVSDDAARVGENNKAVVLPASYAAAVVAGRVASIAPQVSLTNKEVPVANLAKLYTRAEQKLLLLAGVMVLQKQLGFRVLKGNTTDTGPFKQLSVRRIVDYAKAGVRLGANPYIGRLNNERVRAALKATLDGFLSSMVLDEMLTGYKLDVSATRAQEIRGEAIVAMTLQPTFSIDYVKVIMNLA